MNSLQKLLLHLSLIENVGPGLVHKLLNRLSITQLSNLYTLLPTELVHACSISMVQAELICSGLQDKTLFEQELNLLEKHSIRLLTVLDDSYPAYLKHIYRPPTVLYVQGTLTESQNCLAIVGSRKADHYAHSVIKALVPSLVSNDWTIVSGGAIGADTMAHSSTLAAEGETIAVLGSGLLCLYPRQNKRLFAEIIEKGGAVISPFASRVEALRENFPARNRIIAGLSRGCIVVQAAERSGARITANFALEQGREVFAVPGSISDPLSVGCHKLLQQGAKLVTEVSDILVEFGQGVQTDDVVSAKPKTLSERSGKEIAQLEQNSLEQKLLTLCKQPQSIDELVETTGEPLNALQTLLFELQISKKVAQDFSGLWHIV